jgi:hypothetical protein
MDNTKQEPGYYTPTIEEFYIGFEYEYKATDFSDSPAKWIKEVYSKELHNNFPVDIHHSEPTEIEISVESIRVKYLDQGDIESFHFVRSTDDAFWYKYIDNGISIEIYMEGHDGLSVIEEDSTDEYTTRNFLFKGNIKNKSEFVKLMKQIGIRI